MPLLGSLNCFEFTHCGPEIPHLVYVLENPHVCIRYSDHSGDIKLVPSSKQLRPPLIEE